MSYAGKKADSEVTMGQTESKERKLCINLVRCSLAARGLKVVTSQIAQFLRFVQEVCPLFQRREHLV